MAEKDKYEVCDDLLTCPICLELFTDPTLLHCYHTFCRACIQQIMPENTSEKWQCPLCRVVMDCHNIDDLKRNVYVEVLLTFRNATTNRMCEVCESNENINWKCTDCDQFMCAPCHNVHSKLKQSRNHAVILYNPDDYKVRMTKKKYCTKHPDEELRFVCVNCNIPVCRDCKYTLHERHQSKDITEIVSETKSWINNYASSLDENVKIYEMKVTSSRDWKTIVELNARNAEEKLEKFEATLHQQIRQECELFKQKLQEMKQNDLQTISQFEQTVKTRIQIALCMQKYTQQIISAGVNADLVQCKADLQKENVRIQMSPHSYNIVDIKIKPLKIHLQDNVILEVRKGPCLSKKNNFLLECTTNKVVASICLNKENVYVALKYNNVTCKSVLHKMVYLYSESGILLDVLPLPQQHDITFNRKGKLLWYEEDKRNVYLYPPTEESDKTPIAKNCIRPMSIQVCGNNDIVCLHANKTLTRNFKENINTSKLVAPMYICCVNDDIWVTDPGGGQIVVFNKAGIVKFTFTAESFLSLPGKFSPHGICHSKKHQLVFVSDTRNNCVMAISESGDSCFFLLDKKHELETPTCLATNSNHLLVCDKGTRINVYGI